MTTLAASPVRSPDPFDPVQGSSCDAVAVALLLLAVEAAGADRVRCWPMAAPLGDGGQIAATVMIDVGDGALGFPLDVVALAVAALRADPPTEAHVDLATAALAASLDVARATALSHVQTLLRSLN